MGALEELATLLADDPVVSVATGGQARPVAVPDPARALFAATLARATARRPVVLAVPTGVEAERIAADLREYLGADAVELHTGRYAHAPGAGPALAALRDAAALGASLGLAVHAGHGLTTENVGPVAAIPEIEELNIGHHVISRAIFVGLDAAVRELRWAMDVARRPS